MKTAKIHISALCFLLLFSGYSTAEQSSNSTGQYEMEIMEKSEEQLLAEEVAKRNAEGDKFCQEVLGTWSWKGFKEPYELIFREEGKIDLNIKQKKTVPAEVYTVPCGKDVTIVNVVTGIVTGLFAGISVSPFNCVEYSSMREYKWDCSDPKNRIISINFRGSKYGSGFIYEDSIATLSEDSQCLRVNLPDGGDECLIRENYVPADKSKPTTVNKLFGQ